MSVNFNKSHAVDVPVTDLDDEGDDFSFSDHRRSSRNNFANSLNSNSLPSLMSRLRLLLGGSKETKYRTVETNSNSRSNSFELSDFDFQDSDDHVAMPSEPPQRNKNHRLVVALSLVLPLSILLLVGIYRWSDISPSDGHLHTKRILSNLTHDFHPTTVLVSLDGFHPHYINHKNTPAMHKMMVEDYGAPYMVPSFPSSTFPNHWSLVTGLYPSEHGIVGNTFYDPVLKQQFVNTNPDLGFNPEFWQGGEPIWTTAFNQDVSLAVHMWPGSEVPGVGDKHPLFVDKYNGSEPLSAKIDRVMTWIDVANMEDRPELILTYVPTIDQFGHKFGVSGKNLTDALHYVDDFVALMIAELETRNLTEIVNLVFVSDHGMAPTSKTRLVFLDDLVDRSKIEHVDGWPLFGLRPKDAFSAESIYEEILQNLKAAGPEYSNNFHVYRLEDIPKEWNFGGNVSDHRFNYRLAPVWIVPEVGYSITTKEQFEKNGNDYYPKGVHGYNNTELLMRAVFLARGPYFATKLAQNTKVQPFANTEVYGIICDSLDITPSPNNGSLAKSANYPLSAAKVLPQDWKDLQEYPGLPYTIEHIVEDATYDLLWRKQGQALTTPLKVHVSSNGNPSLSLKSEESSLVSVTSVSLPKPSDFLTHEQTTTTKTSGLEKIMEDIGDTMDDVSEAIGDALDDAIGFIGGFFGDGHD